MTYRTDIPKRPEPQRTTVDITTPMRIFVHNGTLATFAFPCWYQEVHPPIPAHLHDRHLHDYHGWPNPRHPDHICQLWIPNRGCMHGRECSPKCERYIDYSKVVPIHLLSEYEGYTGAEVAWVEKPDGVDATAEIDQDEDWVVKLVVDAHDEDALEEPKTYKLTVFVNAPDRRDIVVLAELVVLPSAYQVQGEGTNPS